MRPIILRYHAFEFTSPLTSPFHFMDLTIKCEIEDGTRETGCRVELKVCHSVAQEEAKNTLSSHAHTNTHIKTQTLLTHNGTAPLNIISTVRTKEFSGNRAKLGGCV